MRAHIVEDDPWVQRITRATDGARYTVTDQAVLQER
jgi:hypothetical protein